MEPQDVVISIHGRDYKIRSLQSPEYTRKLARYCDLVMKKIGSNTESVDYIKLSVLTMLQVAHNYFQTEEGVTKPAPKVEKEIEKLLRLIDKTEKEVAAIEAGGRSL